MFETSPQLLLDIAIVLILAKSFGIVSKRLGHSEMVGEILAGMLAAYFLILRPTEALNMLATVGMICLLFRAGLRFDYKEFVSLGFNAFLVALGGLILPIALVYYFIPGNEGLFIGAALAATSVAVVSEILSEQGKTKSAEGKLTMAAAVFDDVLGVVVLSIAIGLATFGFNWATAVFSGIKAFVFIFASIILAAFITDTWLKKGLVLRKYVPTSALLPLFLAVSFLFAFISEQFGLAAVIGAFVAGTLFSELHDSRVVSRELKPFFKVFVPIFFFMIGFHVDVSSIGGIGVIALLLLAIAFVSKIVGCGLPALLSLSPRKAAVVGVLMVPRVEVALVVMSAGLTLSVVSQQMYSAFIFVCLVTLLITPLLVAGLYSERRKEHHL